MLCLPHDSVSAIPFGSMFLPTLSTWQTPIRLSIPYSAVPSLCHLCISRSMHAAQDSYKEMVQISPWIACGGGDS